MSKRYFSLCCTFLFLMLNAAVNAAPKQGWYAGLTLGVSKPKSHDYVFNNPIRRTPQVGDLNYAGFGDIGGQLGYRVEQFRIEGQFIYNYNPYNKLTTPTNTFLGRKDSIPYQMKGYTGIGAIMLNGYFDLMSMNAPSGLYPYLGLGVGYADITNTLSFVQARGTAVERRLKQRPGNYGAPAAQFIVGLGNYLDDFTSVNLEYHYLTAKAHTPFNNRPQVNMLNLTFNGTFDLA